MFSAFSVRCPQPANRSIRQPIRVLFFTPTLGGGGAEMHLLRLINALDRTVFAPSLAVARGGGAYESRLASDVPVHVLTHGIASSTLSIMAAVPVLRRLVASTRPDVLCSVQDHANIAAVVATRGLARPAPLVLSVQVPLREQCRREPSLYNHAVLTAVRSLYRSASRIIALSRGVAHDLCSLEPRLEPITTVVYNAALDDQVRLGAAQPAPRSNESGERIVVACGRLTYQKGFDILLEAVARLRQSLPVRLWLLGEGPDRVALEQKARSLGIADVVTFWGFQSNPFAYMAAADVFVLSSRYEGFGNVIVEAMACGAPVVATDCPHGPSEIITPEVNGLLVPPEDPESLARAIVRVLSDERLRETLQRNGRTRAMDFDACRIAAAYGRVFSELVEVQ